MANTRLRTEKRGIKHDQNYIKTIMKQKAVKKIMLFLFLFFSLKSRENRGYVTSGLEFQKVKLDFMNAKATDYTTILPTGKENAISTNELAVIMGFSDSRSLWRL